MKEENVEKKSFFTTLIMNAQNSIFNLTYELLKENKAGMWYCLFMIIFNFLEILALLFNSNVLLLESNALV